MFGYMLKRIFCSSYCRWHWCRENVMD